MNSNPEPAAYELIRAGLSAINDGDFDRVAAMFAADAELQRVDQLGTLHGREAIRAWLAPDAIEMRRITLTDLQDVGDNVLATCEMEVRGTGTGLEVATTAYMLFTLRDGLAVRLAIYLDEAAAREAAGVPAD
jgi:ketosteroid isomerase-like protein